MTSANYSDFAHPPTADTNNSPSYDPNGNRTNSGSPGTGNRLLSDGTYDFTYDADGNRIAETKISDLTVTGYTWDNANELTSVKQYASGTAYASGTCTSEVAYAYDALGRMVSRTPTGIAGEQTEYYVYDGPNLALVLNSAGQVVEREFYAPGVDQVLASEAGPATTTQQPVSTVSWYLRDNQGTVRDVVRYNGTTSEADHIVYDTFGQITSQTPDATQPTFTYDGLWQDPWTGLDKTAKRWYAAVDAVFGSADPLGFGGGQTNLSEFCANSPTNATDPSGESAFDPVGSVGNSVGDIAQKISDNIDANTTPTDNYMKHNSILGSAAGFNANGLDNRYGSVTRPSSEEVPDHFKEVYEGDGFNTYRRFVPCDDIGRQMVASLGANQGESGGTTVPVRVPFTTHTENYTPTTVKQAVSGAVQGGIYAGTMAFGAMDAAAEAFAEAGSPLAGQTSLELLKQCFPAGTLVATPRGLFPIETLKAGDEVWAYDLVQSRWCARLVLKKFVNDHDGTSATITVADEAIEATFLHPFWVVHGDELASRPVRGHLPSVPQGATTSGRWVDAGDVRVGDELLLRDGRILPVQAIRHQPYRDKVYNIHVDDLQCYAVGQNSVLVHNSNGPRWRFGGDGASLNSATRSRLVGNLTSQLQELDDAALGAQAVGDWGAAMQYLREWNTIYDSLQSLLNGVPCLN